MNDQHHPPLGVAVDRDVGRLPRYSMRVVTGSGMAYIKHAEDADGGWTCWAEAQAKLDHLRAENEALRAENIRLREWITREADANDTCTFGILGEVCPGCRCTRGMKPNAEVR